jgi:hypothetical protein
MNDHPTNVVTNVVTNKPIQYFCIDDIVQFIVTNKTNSINYDLYNHNDYLKQYKDLFTINNINYKLYNLDKYIEFIRELDINKHIYSL